MSGHDNEDLIDYEDEHDVPTGGATTTTNGGATGAGDAEGKDKKNFSGIHSTGFRSVPLSSRLYAPLVFMCLTTSMLIQRFSSQT